MRTLDDYRRLREGFNLEVPGVFNYTADVIDDWAARDPDRPALVAVAADGTTITRRSFGGLAADADRAAHVLRSHGIGRGDRLLVQLPRVVEWYAVLLGAFKVGAVPIPGTTQLQAKDLQYRLNRSGALAIVCDEDGAAKVDHIGDRCPTLRVQLLVGGDRPGWRSWDVETAAAGDGPAEPERTRSSDPLLIYFTSGTTANPKMVLHTHASLGIGHDITARFWHDLTPDDVMWAISDTGWAKAAWGKLFGQWRIGASVVMWNIVGKPDFDRLLQLIAELGVTCFCAPPTLYRAFVQMDLSTYDWSSLRHCTSAGEPLNPEVISAWEAATGTIPYDGYGQTETTCLVANYPGLPVKPGSMGLPTPGFDVEIVDDEGNVLAVGEEGHIAVRTDPRPVGLFVEYWKDPERNAEAFRQGWYYTGDRAFKDEDGYIWFVGRADDVILSAAYRIGPFEVESALIEHPGVVEAAVVGKPDSERGHIVKAFVVLADGYEASEELARELQDHVKAITAPYKYPREVAFLDELPKTVSGKIRRVELRSLA